MSSFSTKRIYLLVTAVVSLLSLAFALTPVSAQELVTTTPLSTGQVVNGMIEPAARHSFAFNASLDAPLRLNVDSESAEAGVVVSLRDALNGELLAFSNMRFSDVRFGIPAGAESYLLEIAHSGSLLPELFTVCLQPASADDCDIQPVAGPACLVSAAQNVNVRSGAGMNYGVIGTLIAGTSVSVVERSTDFSWFHINGSGLNGWVSASVVSVSGECAGVAPVNPPQGPIDPGIGNGEQPGGPQGQAQDTGVDVGEVPPDVIEGINDAVNGDNDGIDLGDVPPEIINSINDAVNGDDTTIIMPPGGLLDAINGDNDDDDDDDDCLRCIAVIDNDQGNGGSQGNGRLQVRDRD